MKKLIFSLFIIFSFLIIIISCGSTKVETPAEEPEAPEKEEVSFVDQTEDEVVFVEDDEVEDVSEDEEYLRSIELIDPSDVVSRSQFNDDKAEILNSIDELSEIMETKDVNAWLKYITPESKQYYANPANLRKAQRKLPNKLIQLKTITDYFNYVFIPSRQISRVDEIRYISSTEVKAVEVKPDYSIVVYYYFKKIKGKWLVHIPPVD